MSGRAPRRRLHIDSALLHLTLALLVVGVAAVFDASYARSLDARSIGYDGFHYLKRQAVFAAVGIAVMLLAMHIGTATLRRLAVPLLGVAIAGLIAVWLPVVGIEDGGANRWVGWGPIRAQPSEFAKLALVLYLAALVSRRGYPIRDLREGFLPPLFVVVVVAALIEREPDLGTALVVALTGLTVLFTAGARARHIGAIAAIGLVAVVLATVTHPYRIDRVRVLLDPSVDPLNAGFQVRHGLIAVGSGGLTGQGIGAGREKYFLPAFNTDYIFATVAEETGLIGSLLVVALLGGLGMRAFVVARRHGEPFGQLVAVGIASMICWQGLINIAVVTGCVPATGVPLPFVSYGGSSLVLLLGGVGLLLGIASQSAMPGARTIPGPRGRAAPPRGRRSA
ncbi:MAG: putative lipid II flippase FtsW [Chthonomonadales bacterium]|nr:putative lipid II flippase FtsW [Chthonomonadales bacterium]